MATVTGSLTDFGLANLLPYSPRILFIPSGPAVGPGGDGARFLISSRPVVCIPTGIGAFSAELYPNESAMPATHYGIRIEWKDPNAFGDDRGYIGIDSPDWELRVPNEGGDITELLTIPSNPAQAWVGELPPANPTPGTWWLMPSTGALSEWSN